MQNKPIKILIDARSLGKRPSGIGMYVYNIVRELKKDRDFTMELATDICESSEMRELKDGGMPVHMYGKEVSKSLMLFSYYRFLQKCIYECRPDIFWEANHLVPIRIRNPYGNLVSTVHDMFAITEPEHYGKKYQIYFRYGMKKTIRYFDAFIYDSEESKDDTEKLFPQAKAKKSYIGYFIVPDMPKVPVTDDHFFLYIGNLETRKGTDILLKAYSLYRSKGGRYNLHLAGNLRNRKIEQMLERMTNDPDSGVHYLGYLDTEEKVKEYASCSCFVFPSRSEGFGAPIIEAMHYNKPVLAADLPVFREISENSIQYVSFAGTDEEGIQNFAAALLKEEQTPEKPAEGCYDKVLDRYSEHTLGRKYRQIMKECAE